MEGLNRLYDLKAVGDVRGLGMMAAVELVSDRETREPFDAADKVGDRVRLEMMKRGLFTRTRGEIIALAPPLVTTDEQIDRIVEIVGSSIEAVMPEKA